MKLSVVVGNPRPDSRTLKVATQLARRLAEEFGQEEFHVLDLATLGPALLDAQDERVQSEVVIVQSSTIVIFASPTYKASFTGLLKLLLDQIPNGTLGGVVAVPVMTGGAATHALAVEVHLRPVLVELGATVPTRGLYVLESQFGALDEVMDTWYLQAERTLRPLVNRESSA